MPQHVMTDQVGIRFGLGAGVLFALTGAIVASPLPGALGVGALLAVTAVLAAALDRAHAVGLALAGWAFATGFSVHAFGVLTFAPPDLVRLAVFVLVATSACRLRAAS